MNKVPIGIYNQNRRRPATRGIQGEDPGPSEGPCGPRTVGAKRSVRAFSSALI